VDQKYMAMPGMVIGGARYHSCLIVENSEQLRAGIVSSLTETNTDTANVPLLHISVGVV
jgi:hypothetical protein